MTHLKAGDKAPDFKATIETGETVTLSDFEGSTLALFFYPKDNTPGCTAEVKSLRDGIEQLEKQNIKVLGVSPDTEKSHQKFIEKQCLPFHLISDSNHEVLKAYGVWGPKKFMGREYIGVHRTTFLIGPDGTIIDVIQKVKTKDHAHQILDLISELSH